MVELLQFIEMIIVVNNQQSTTLYSQFCTLFLSGINIKIRTGKTQTGDRKCVTKGSQYLFSLSLILYTYNIKSEFLIEIKQSIDNDVAVGLT